MAARADGNLLTRPQRLAWLRLIRSDNVGPVTFRQLLNRFGSAEAAIEALPSLARNAGIGTRIASAGEAEEELGAVERMGARLVASGEADYPPLLRYISAPPPLVAIAGGDNLDWSRTVGVVGARNASAAGQKMTKVLAGISATRAMSSSRGSPAVSTPPRTGPACRPGQWRCLPAGSTTSIRTRIFRWRRRSSTVAGRS